MNELNEMFTAENNNETTSNARSLSGTAQLTTLSTSIASDILNAIDANFEIYKTQVAASKVEHKAMDSLIAAAYPIADVDVEFLKTLDDETIDGMLKSQQSKRSRSKGKVMTMDNYKAMMVGAIAENLIRLAAGKEKSAGSRRVSGSVEYTAEQLVELENDQEKLRKEIRNVQSKKSIMKSKEGFSEDSDGWQQLLIAEAALKGIRTETKTITVDDTKDALAELLGETDITTMKNSDAKELLKKIAALTAGKVAE